MKGYWTEERSKSRIIEKKMGLKKILKIKVKSPISTIANREK